MTSTENQTAAEYYPSPEAWMEEGGKVYLLGSCCPQCGKYAFPHRPVCDQCGNDAGLERVKLTNTGKLYSFSEVFIAPKVFAAPYVIGYVDLPEDVRVCGQVEHPAAELAVDQTVEVVLGVIRTSESGGPVISYKFRKPGGTGNA